MEIKVDTIGKRIKYARQQKNISQKELASKFGVSASVIGQYEIGLRTPKKDRIAELSILLDVDYLWLLTGYEEYEENGVNYTLCQNLDGSIRYKPSIDYEKIYKKEYEHLIKKHHIDDGDFNKISDRLKSFDLQLGLVNSELKIEDLTFLGDFMLLTNTLHHGDFIELDKLKMLCTLFKYDYVHIITGSKSYFDKSMLLKASSAIDQLNKNAEFLTRIINHAQRYLSELQKND